MMADTEANGFNQSVVVIGGGTGISHVLTGLKRYNVNLTAIVTMFDSGGSSGLLRTEFGYPPLGDLRQCLLALGDETQETRILRDVFEFRFGLGTSLKGHSVGNLVLAALTSLDDDVEQAIARISRVLQVRGQVVPVTLQRADLCAELEDGHVIQGESNIDLRSSSTPRINRIFLAPEVTANPKAIQAVMESDAIVLGPGDLYTSVLPNLLPTGMQGAIAESKATCIYVSNLMTKHGETDGFNGSDFIREVARYLKPAALDWAIVNSAMPSEAIQRAYESESAYPVRLDREDAQQYARGVLPASLASSERPLRHDPDRTAAAILKAMETGTVAQAPATTATTIMSNQPHLR